jgi:hypothetical protein
MKRETEKSILALKKAFWHYGDDPRNNGFIPPGCFFRRSLKRSAPLRGPVRDGKWHAKDLTNLFLVSDRSRVL